MSNSPIKSVKPLGFPWETQDPFLFCVHHKDFYPEGNEKMGPKASLEGRNIGQDFTIKDGWRMYHGQEVPGFPAHPHRGFETVTIATQGLIDHSDSLGAAGRFGNGDVQWMTAGKGVQHSEMFPLLKTDDENTMELFQIWLNLPKSKKMAEPYFSMLWNEDIPYYHHEDENGNKTSIKVVAGGIENVKAPPPAPDSWAFTKENEVAIWVVKISANGKFTLPLASAEVNRSIYFYEGESVKIADQEFTSHNAIELFPDQETTLLAGKSDVSLLMLQGKPIQEQVVQYGPFVMNSNEEIQEAFQEFQQTQFGGWPWPTHEHVHPRETGRFALYPNGDKIEK